jgi:cell division protease FtsH
VSFWVVLGLAAIALFVPLATIQPPTSASERTYSEFMNEVRAGEVSAVRINSATGGIEGTLDGGESFTTRGPVGGLPASDLRALETNDVAVTYEAPARGSSWIGSALGLLLPIVVMVAFFVWIARRSSAGLSGATAFGRNPGHVYTTERPLTTFRDVAGYEAVKDDIREVVDFLKDPGVFRAAGARIPKGILLAGPPGTGKTLLAKAVAGEAGVAFISVTGSHFMEMFVGVGAARVRGLFEAARQQGRAIIFVDEIDSIGRKRGTGTLGGHDERDQTLNQLLAEMDGFETTEGIVVMAATNRPDILDPALLRAGRFDRQVLVPLPTVSERAAILEIHARDKQLGPDVDLELIARGTPGMSGADLANLVNEAALGAVRAGDSTIAAEHFDAARDRLLMGLRRTSMVLSDRERWAVAHHEAGHAVLAHLLTHADPVHKVTILPSSMALGATQQMPTNERHLFERRYLLDSIAVQLGGRTAEELTCEDISTGAANDLAEATRLARQMVRDWGMCDRLGPIALGSATAGDVLDQTAVRDFSDETAHLVDLEVERLLGEQRDRARLVLGDHLAALKAVAQALIERETLSGDEVARIIEEHRGTPPSANGRAVPVALVPVAAACTVGRGLTSTRERTFGSAAEPVEAVH